MSYKDRDTLYEMYHERGMSMADIGNALDCSPQTVSNWMDRHGIESRRADNEKDGCYRLEDSQGYGNFETRSNGHRASVGIHRLTAVAWFGLDAVGDKDVHHINGHKFDNRECNLEPLNHSTHMRQHATKRWNQKP